MPIGGGGEGGGVAVSQCCQARYTSPRLLHISRRGGEGEIDKRNIEIAAMTNYIGSEGGGREEGRRSGSRGLQLMHCAFHLTETNANGGSREREGDGGGGEGAARASLTRRHLNLNRRLLQMLLRCGFAFVAMPMKNWWSAAAENTGGRAGGGYY